MPDFTFSDTENNTFTNRDIPDESPLMLIYFRTDCDECRHMAQVLQEKAEDYPVTIWMVSPNDAETLSTFAYMTGLLDKKNLQVLQDSRDMMHKWFSFTALPYIVLFDKNRDRLQVYTSLPDVETVKKRLAQ